jgi:hypothetical protein
MVVVVPRPSRKPKDSGLMHPARSGFPLAGTRVVEPLGRGATTTVASLLADRLAIGETE